MYETPSHIWLYHVVAMLTFGAILNGIVGVVVVVVIHVSTFY